MKTTIMPSSDKIEHKWLLVDATNMPLGRLASQVANLIRGKHKTVFSPHVDCGDYVIILNCDKVILTGKKLTDKYHYSYSGYQGGLKKTQYKILMETKPEFVVREAVKGMLPKTRLGRNQIKKLKAYAGEAHEHAAQQPTLIKLVGGRN